MGREDSLALTRSTLDDNVTYNKLRESVCRKAELVTKLTRLRNNLSMTVTCWRLFQDGDILYFQDNNTQSKATRGMRDTLRAIKGVYTRLQTKLERLESLMKQLGDDQVFVGAHPITRRMTKLKPQTAEKCTCHRGQSTHTTPC